MSNDLIVEVYLLLTIPHYGKYPAEHSRSAGRAAGFTEPAAPGFLQTCTERGGVRVQNCVPSDEITGMLHLEHGAPRLFRSNRYENASFARFIAGDLGFLVLIQSHDGPAR